MSFSTLYDLRDCVSFVAFCKIDSTMLLLSTAPTGDYWLPSSKVNGQNSWYKQVTEDIQDIFGEKLIPSNIIRVNRVWLPDGVRSGFIYHCIYELIVPTEGRKRTAGTSGKFKNKVLWVNEQEITKFNVTCALRSPEVFELFMNVKHGAKSQTTLNAEHVQYLGNIAEHPNVLLLFKNRDFRDCIIESSGLDKEALEVLYREFLLMTFPATYLGYNGFLKFLIEAKWNKEEAPHLFRAADSSRRYGLTYREFIYFIAVAEPYTSHGGASAEIRCHYIFRYYDKDQDNLLNLEEFKSMLIGVRKAKKFLDMTDINKEVAECYRSMGINQNQSVGIPEFLKAVGDLKIRGTSQMLRAIVSIQQYVKDTIERNLRMAEKTRNTARVFSGNDLDVLKMRKPYSKGATYELGLNAIRIEKTGNLITFEKLGEFDTTIFDHPSSQPKYPKNAMRLSIEFFSKSTFINELINDLRHVFNLNKKNVTPPSGTKPKYDWGLISPVTFAKNLIQVCEHARDVFKNEPRLLDLVSPIYIMGDLHGNFSDLLHFEKVLFHVGPALSPVNLLFLGDYVDRGAFGMEVIAYLFAYKLLNPTKVGLVRGNHEIREIQKMFTFYNELQGKFGDKVGIDIWNAINSAFDNMPLAATVDGRVFCCHGGIPPPWICPIATAINDIPVPLNSPDAQSSVAWDIMWNDPVKSAAMNEQLSMELQANEGFAANVRRGTAHVFNYEAVERFLMDNDFSHIIRAHETAPAGIHIQLKGKVLTVFSSSRYCGGLNQAACILADQAKLRVLRLQIE